MKTYKSNLDEKRNKFEQWSRSNLNTAIYHMMRWAELLLVMNANVLKWSPMRHRELCMLPTESSENYIKVQRCRKRMFSPLHASKMLRAFAILSLLLLFYRSLAYMMCWFGSQSQQVIVIVNESWQQFRSEKKGKKYFRWTKFSE